MASVPSILEKMPSGRVTSRELARQIFEAQFPEQFVRSIPAQGLYCILKAQGLEASSDIVEIATVEQCRIMIDLDCWEKWNFREDSVWDWLSLSDDAEGLKLLQKILRSIDLKLVALLIARHVEVISFEEPTENPPGQGWYTPDKGSTWLSIKIEDGTKHFLLGRLLAMLFESDADLFYRILGIAVNTTQSELEESAFQERSKHLSAEGIPDQEMAHEISSPISEAEIAAKLKANKRPAVTIDVLAVQPLIYDSALLQPLASILGEIGVREEIENELTYIINAAIVRWNVPFYESEEVRQLVEKVKGALNLGLEFSAALGRTTPLQSFEALGLKNIYRLGLEKLFELKKRAHALRKELEGKSPMEAELEAVLSCAEQPFPAIPKFMKESQSESENEISTQKSPVEPCPIETLDELKSLLEFVSVHR